MGLWALGIQGCPYSMSSAPLLPLVLDTRLVIALEEPSLQMRSQ
jgi:hypothetical protein